jgi:hypothetical protein
LDSLALTAAPGDTRKRRTQGSERTYETGAKARPRIP